ncbi:calcineurin temperature suppressor Cts1 [Coprinopsis cinerea okayama7|uniref:Calcineurin temperature suppressor Cts1 n=1 Tax=Coprinopsis cinerea (strain Okayama-7 / 130 / ATCC MYA-4618 / FGSC 9003) TaxID=240176 RepID=D6RMR9_COPC7|nr:calcineurin temperature suppressor Cts1 [Coprinopsis cinerea okayama7\|eukprot:XP_002911234.1 calcineurin temperature suppressor Cts1 [Coprinopsis cinerea okayama7\
MSSTPREIGTLIVVVLKANHLPNKRHIGKQDPYCVVTVNGEKRRTKAIKRGGQHPEWDEEIRFTLFENTDDVLARTARSRDDTPPPLPPKDTPLPERIKGGKFMKLACYADDAREPDLIGETDVDLTEVLTKGETDEWFNLSNKDKFAGKVYLELTFWSNEPPPEKKAPPKPPKANKQYGGPGSFVPSGERPPGQHLARHASASAGYPANGPPDLYVAPYEQRNPVDKLAQDFGEFGINGGHRRRESYPPPVPSGFSQYSQTSYNHYPPTEPTYTYDRAASPNTQPSSFHPPANAYAYQPPYDPNAPAQYPPPARGPRHSVPASSSGFVPLPQPSGFVPLQPQTGDPYPPPVSHTPAPLQYPPAPSQFATPYPQTASPVSYNAAPNPPPGSYQQPVPATQPYTAYATYPFPTSGQPSQQYQTSEYTQTVPSPAQSQVYQPYPGPPPHESPASLPQPPATVGGSRPLPPQPQIVYAQPPPPPPPPTQHVNNPPPPPSHISPPQNGGYSPPHQGSVSPARVGTHPLPLPPPPPPPLYSNDGSNFVPSVSPSGPPLPPPPPPASVVHEVRQRRLSSLPQPPVMYQPPYPPTNGTQDSYSYSQPPQTYANPPGPPPKPPASEWTGYGGQ